ncbi:glycoside hydrolase family 15 protein [Streptomyces sp. NPDC020883]|uniref:glycoside hydrolase family 15 protein n=1 Tax=Streptomyces sp. NPDC020883 TaxID=3365099 RepID=UPI00378CAF24
MLQSPIDSHHFVSDLHTGCLVNGKGTVDWLPLPGFNSPAAFACLLGTEEHGFWTIAPRDPAATPIRRYAGDTLIGRTTWTTPKGTVVVFDVMPPYGAQGHQPHLPQLVRIVRCLDGSVRMTSRARVMMGYGRITPRYTKVQRPYGGSRVREVAGEHSIWLDSSVETDRLPGGLTVADFTLRKGEEVAFCLTWQSSHLQAPLPIGANAALRVTQSFWERWISQCAYRGEYLDAVRRASLTIKGACYGPTGAIVAAPTTSLPEVVGGERNWDYRYTWLRDSALAVQCLLRLGYRKEARDWRNWLLRSVAGDPEKLQIMYSITGERDLPETSLDLPGHRGSQPVRIGNGAAQQLQLDVYGWVVDTLYQAAQHGIDHDEDAFQLVVALLRQLEQVWQRPDEGIWEVRGQRRHFVHSKAMAWLAFDRGARYAEHLGRSEHVDAWRTVADTIHAEVCHMGYDQSLDSFTQSYGSKRLDAALLQLPLIGFLPASDKRIISTVEAIQRELATDIWVHRYRTTAETSGVDGLTGQEGAFLWCSFLLVEALVLIDHPVEARVVYERLLSLRNDVGLLAEEYEPDTGEQLGNFPQVLSMCGVVLGALALDNHQPRDQVASVGSRLPRPRPVPDVHMVSDTATARESSGETSPCVPASEDVSRRWPQVAVQGGVLGQSEGGPSAPRAEGAFVSRETT